MNKSTTLSLRGVAIIGIVLHHITNFYVDLGNKYIFLIFNQSGYALTAVFSCFQAKGAIIQSENLKIVILS